MLCIFVARKVSLFFECSTYIRVQYSIFIVLVLFMFRYVVYE